MAKIRAAVLATSAALDSRINAGIPAVRGALQAARVVHKIEIYPKVDHVLLNDTGPRCKADA